MELSLPSAFLRSSIVPAVWYLATSAGYKLCWTADKIVAAIRIIFVMLAPASVRPLVPSLASLAPALFAQRLCLRRVLFKIEPVIMLATIFKGWMVMIKMMTKNWWWQC